MVKKFNLIFHFLKRPKVEFITALILISIIYLLLRFVYPNTVEFGYDQPRTATLILDFKENGNFFTSQNYTQGTVAGSTAWGPSFVYFYLPILSMSANPIIASMITAVISMISVWVVMLICYKFLSYKIGIIAGLTLALHPWWILFSRMIYQPTPTPIFISISILCLFMAIKYKDSIWGGILFISYGVLFQLYIINITFALSSLLLGIIFAGRYLFSKKNALIGLIGNLFIFIPTILYFIKNPHYLVKYINAGSAYKTNLIEATVGYMKTLSGGNMRWQLGYGYIDFIKYSNLSEGLFNLIMIIIFSIILFGIYKIFKNKNKYEISIVVLTITPLWAIPLIGVEHVLPRYFLYVLPQFSILFSISVRYLFLTIGRVIVHILLIVYIFWIVLIFRYYKFIISFNYTNGFVSNWSDTTYASIDNIFKWVDEDIKIKGYDTYIINEGVSESQKYYLRYIFNPNSKNYGKIGKYEMGFRPEPSVDDIYVSGPYYVFEEKSK